MGLVVLAEFLFGPFGILRIGRRAYSLLSPCLNEIIHIKCERNRCPNTFHDFAWLQPPEIADSALLFADNDKTATAHRFDRIFLLVGHVTLSRKRYSDSIRVILCKFKNNAKLEVVPRIMTS
ncbi:hypothetical protein BKG68_04295 [Mycobacteroides saopaulense]|uniref:Uncharacterized protein n=1 Tax=Mycobacteroides saopaulense TaxID=1578165 RepID=A0ABX3C5Z3_9MYCO|nr:hypothetical protein BKG68_04295 [Mycobacteroides saopaulense]OHU13896.1 hypothetical protein BKG73_04305 [Mycobacteroides saopaulense]